MLGSSSVLKSDQSPSRVPSEPSPSQSSPAFLLPQSVVLGPLDRDLFVLHVLLAILLLSQSSYFWPLGMVAPSRVSASCSNSLATPRAKPPRSAPLRSAPLRSAPRRLMMGSLPSTRCTRSASTKNCMSAVLPLRSSLPNTVNVRARARVGASMSGVVMTTVAIAVAVA
jgi:hypothetical protein